MAKKNGEELRRTLVEELLHRAAAAWERYQEAHGNMEAMREAYEAFIRLLLPLYKNGFKKEVEDFLKKTESVPVRAVIRRLHQ